MSGKCERRASDRLRTKISKTLRLRMRRKRGIVEKAAATAIHCRCWSDGGHEHWICNMLAPAPASALLSYSCSCSSYECLYTQHHIRLTHFTRTNIFSSFHFAFCLASARFERIYVTLFWMLCLWLEYVRVCTIYLNYHTFYENDLAVNVIKEETL